MKGTEKVYTFSVPFAQGSGQSGWGRVVAFRLVETVFDRGFVHDLELAALDLGDVLDAEALVDLAVEGLFPLRMLRTLGELGQRLSRLDQLGAILRPLVAGTSPSPS